MRLDTKKSLDFNFYGMILVIALEALDIAVKPSPLLFLTMMLALVVVAINRSNRVRYSETHRD